MIYFVQSGNFVKIGFVSGDTLLAVYRRMEAFQTGNPNSLKLLGVMSGKCGIEHRIHRQFAASRERGEWFLLTTDLQAYISKNALSEDEASSALVECPVCKGTFLPSTPKHRICSEECREKRICIGCGAAFRPECPWKKYYCSLECYDKGI